MIGLSVWPASIFDDGDGRHDASSAATVAENRQLNGRGYLTSMACRQVGIIKNNTFVIPGISTSRDDEVGNVSIRWMVIDDSNVILQV